MQRMRSGGRHLNVRIASHNQSGHAQLLDLFGRDNFEPIHQIRLNARTKQRHERRRHVFDRLAGLERNQDCLALLCQIRRQPSGQLVTKS
jgi:hypothetical protein